MTARRVKLTQKTVDAAKPEAARYVLHDTETPGFRLVVSPVTKRNPEGRKTFMFAYRVGGGRGGRQREPMIGTAPPMKAEAARRRAEEWYSEVRKGGDPAGARAETRAAPTCDDLFDRYISDHARPKKKARSIEEDEALLRQYLRPEFGRLKVLDVDEDDVQRFHAGMASKPIRGNRAVALLSKAFALAEGWKMRPRGTNPCVGLEKYEEKARKRFLAPAELARLGEALRVADRDGALTLPARRGVRAVEERVVVNPWAVAAIRLLIFTGARKTEVLSLRWEWIDAENGRACLPDSKTGEKVVLLPPPALAVLARLPRDAANPHVLRGAKPSAHLVNVKDAWAAVREAADLLDVRIHDLRHSFASIGAAGGASLPIIGALLGHSQPQTTQRYAHLHDDPLRAAAASIGSRIAAAMGDADTGASSSVVALRR